MKWDKFDSFETPCLVTVLETLCCSTYKTVREQAETTQFADLAAYYNDRFSVMTDSRKTEKTLIKLREKIDKIVCRCQVLLYYVHMEW